MPRSHDSLRPTVARIWRGRVPRARADEYARYSLRAGIEPLADKALGVHMLREDSATETEFMTISWWASVEAMTSFAGDDPRRIHHLARDPEFLIEMPDRVQILDIVATFGKAGWQ
jgi:hypothetical protein